MNDSKPWYASKGVWGSVFAALTSVLIFVQTVILSGASQEIQDQAGQVIEVTNDPNTAAGFVAVGGFISAIVALIGRLTATTTVSSK